MPKNHHGRHHHGWIVNSEKSMPTEQAAQLVEMLAGKIQESRHFKLNGVTVEMPENCHFVMRYERRPKGELVLKTEMVWYPEEDAGRGIDDAFVLSDAD
jgi:hypothetical protein